MSSTKTRPALRSRSVAPADVPTSGAKCSLEKVADEVRTVGREYAFGMKLDAFDGQRSVAHAHDFAFRGARGHLEHGWDAVRLRDQRVITARLEWLAHAGVQPFAVMRDGRDL